MSPLKRRVKASAPPPSNKLFSYNFYWKVGPTWAYVDKKGDPPGLIYIYIYTSKIIVQERKIVRYIWKCTVLIRGYILIHESMYKNQVDSIKFAINLFYQFFKSINAVSFWVLIFWWKWRTQSDLDFSMYGCQV